MAILTVDVAFDWDSHGKSGYDGFCLTGASGFDMALAGSSPPQGTRGLGKNDELQFQIWDISDAAANRTLSDLAISFQSAHAANTSDYPFEAAAMGKEDKGWYPLANLTLGPPLVQGTSGVFGGPFTNWQVSPRPLALPNDGWYFFKVSFKATTGKQTKSFGNDPEMIVRPTG